MQDKKPILGPMPCCDEKADYVRTNVSWLMWCGAKIAIAVGVGGSLSRASTHLADHAQAFYRPCSKTDQQTRPGLVGHPGQHGSTFDYKRRDVFASQGARLRTTVHKGKAHGISRRAIREPPQRLRDMRLASSAVALPFRGATPPNAT